MDQSKHPSYPDLKGKVAFVTGGSRGIGAATCRMLAANGVRVAVNGRDAAAIDGVVRAVRDAAVRRSPRPPIARAARSSLGPTTPFIESSVTSTSCRVCWRQRRADAVPSDVGGEVAVRHRREPDSHVPYDSRVRAGDGRTTTRNDGDMSSSAGRLPGLASPPYAAAKAGIGMLTGHLARELAPMGVRVNCVAPSAIMNDRLAKVPPEKLREIRPDSRSGVSARLRMSRSRRSTSSPTPRPGLLASRWISPADASSSNGPSPGGKAGQEDGSHGSSQDRGDGRDCEHHCLYSGRRSGAGPARRAHRVRQGVRSRTLSNRGRRSRAWAKCSGYPRVVAACLAARRTPLR